jgi:excisionase family DNA binding protein
VGAEKRKIVLEELREKGLYDTKEAMALLGVSQQSLRRAIKSGRIKTVRLGRLLRITSEELEKLVRGDKVLLTAQEAAEILGVSTFMIRELIKSGKIDAFRLANKGPFKIPKSEIDRISREGIPQ